MRLPLLGFVVAVAVAALALTTGAMAQRADPAAPCRWSTPFSTVTPGAMYQATASIQPGPSAISGELVLEFLNADDLVITIAQHLYT